MRLVYMTGHSVPYVKGDKTTYCFPQVRLCPLLDTKQSDNNRLYAITPEHSNVQINRHGNK